MPSNNSLNYPQGLDQGLPARLSTASTPLWTHLLQPNGSRSSNLASLASESAPPLKPIDKNATSMRILLHDTQANFENFTVHAGKLLDGIKETRHEIKTTHTLFERDREAMISDIIDLVNRSQKETLKSIGIPAQKDSVESFFRDVNHRFNGLEQRLEAIQAFNQTHTQALQTQIQAVQILLDKQASILTAVLPLLPLLQTVPLHIEATKSDILQNLAKLLSSWEPILAQIPNSSLAVPKHPTLAETLGKRKRENSRLSASSSSPIQPIRVPSQKKMRTGSPRQSTPRLPGLSSENIRNPREESIACNFSLLGTDASRQNKTSTPSASGPSPIASAGASESESSRTTAGTLTARSFTATPRRPLLDLLLPPLPRQNSTPRKSGAPYHAQAVHVTDSSTLSKRLSSEKFSGMTPSVSRPPRILRAQTSFSNKLTRSGMMYATNGSKPGSENQSPRLSPTPSSNSPVQQKIESRASSIKLPSRKQPETDAVDFRLAAPSFAQNFGSDASSMHQSGLTSEPKSASENTAHPIKKVPPGFAAGKPNGGITPPVREGRRFIPLVDSEDDEEEN